MLFSIIRSIIFNQFDGFGLNVYIIILSMKCKSDGSLVSIDYVEGIWNVI